MLRSHVLVKMATPQIPEKHRGDPALGQAAAALIWPTRQASPGGGLVVGSVQWSCSSLPHPAIPSYQAANHQPQKIPPRLSFCLGRGLFARRVRLGLPTLRGVAVALELAPLRRPHEVT